MIYFIEANRSYKIGFSKTPEKRVATLQTAQPERIKLLGIANGSRREEQLLHYFLQQHRLEGEWFQRSATVKRAVAIALTLGVPSAIEFAEQRASMAHKHKKKGNWRPKEGPSRLVPLEDVERSRAMLASGKVRDADRSLAIKGFTRSERRELFAKLKEEKRNEQT